MRYRVDTYSISGQNITLTGITTVTVADVRLIVDETVNKVICSSMQKSNISCSNNVIQVSPSVATLDSNHVYTIELDFGEKPADLAQEASLGDLADALNYIETGGLPTLDSNIARQGDNPNANISDIQANTVNLAALVNNTLTTNIITSSIVSMAGVPVVEVDPTDTTLVADPNKLYLISGRTGTGAADLSISLHEPSSQSTDVQEYHFLFDGGATSTITWEPIYYETAQADQTSIIWQQGLPPQLSSGQDFYEVGILNGIGLWMYYSSSNN